MGDTLTKRKRGRKPKIPTTETANDVVIFVPSTEPTTDPNNPSPSSRARGRGRPRKIKKHDNTRPNIAASPERRGSRYAEPNGDFIHATMTMTAATIATTTTMTSDAVVSEPVKWEIVGKVSSDKHEAEWYMLENDGILDKIVMILRR